MPLCGSSVPSSVLFPHPATLLALWHSLLEAMFELPGDGDKSAPEARRESHGRNLQPRPIIFRQLKQDVAYLLLRIWGATFYQIKKSSPGTITPSRLSGETDPDRNSFVRVSLIFSSKRQTMGLMGRQQGL